MYYKALDPEKYQNRSYVATGARQKLWVVDWYFDHMGHRILHAEGHESKLVDEDLSRGGSPADVASPKQLEGVGGEDRVLVPCTDFTGVKTIVRFRLARNGI